MEDKNFDFAATKDALSQLSTDLIEMEAALQMKQASLNKDKENSLTLLNEKDQKISILTSAIQSSLADIEKVNSYIEGAL